MAPSRPSLRPVALVRETLGLLVSRFSLLFPIALVPALGLAIFGFALGLSEPVPLDPVTGTSATEAGFGSLFLGILLEILFGFVASGVLMLAALDALLGTRKTIGAHLTRTLRRSGPILVLGTLLYMVAGIGLAFFVLPGFYILARFLPWLATILVEDEGWSGLTRAQELTQGQRLSLVGAIAVLAVLGIAAAFLLSPFVALAASAGSPALVLLEAAATALWFAVAACFTAVAYLRLHAISEETDPASTAETVS